MENIILNFLKYIALGASIYLMFRYIPNHSMSNTDILIVAVIIMLIYIVFDNIFSTSNCSILSTSQESDNSKLCNTICNNKKEGMENINELDNKEKKIEMEILRGSDNLDGNNKQVKYDQNGFIYDNYDKYEQSKYIRDLYDRNGYNLNKENKENEENKENDECKKYCEKCPVCPVYSLNSSNNYEEL